MSLKRPRWLSRNVWTLSWVSFLQDAASEMLYPIMPIFLYSVLGAPAAVVGIIEGLAEGTAATTKLFSDQINRFLPRKVAVFLGYTGAAVGKVIIALSFSWPVVLLGRVTDRFGKGLRSAPRDTILFLGTQRSERGRVLGFHRTADTLGAVVGPALALLLLSLFDQNLRIILWIAVIPAVISPILVLLVKDSEKRPPRATPATITPPPTTKFSSATVPATASPSARLPAPLARLITVLSVFSLANFPDALILLHLSLQGFSVTSVVGAYLIFNISYALLSFPAGALADRFPPQFVYALGLACFAIAYGGLALTSDPAVAIALVIVYGGFAAVNDTVGKSWASKLAPEHQQLQAQARLQGFAGFAILLASIWAGLLWEMGPGDGIIPLGISSAVAVVAGIYIAVFTPRMKAGDT
ncbi:MFS transporter [Alpinimonas psychrophila]|uniref:MFS family permease n=1 Tax=Alpinimonas psychrophila TaxID=748908 RepID=A0A7W3PNB0_9MICO|nr:MFS transporter [Alpinimonas psychrophila]MBA8828257.1 MFS family permease [Alpinimonas psychrophila]